MNLASYTRRSRRCVSERSAEMMFHCQALEAIRFFSPDGQWLAFFTEDGLRRMPAGGGALELVTAERAGREREDGGSWGPDGTIVFSRGGGLLRVSAQGGETTIVADPEHRRR